MSKLKFALLSATLFAAAPAIAQAPAAPAPASAAPAAPLPDADPAIWVVKDADTTIYLFGTFHALDGKVAWFNDEVKTAFDKSSELVLEIPPIEDKAALQPVILKYALDTSGKPLSGKLSATSREKYAKALAELGAPPTAFDQFKPFFAALTLIMANAQKLGITGENGAEAVLAKAAKDENKPVSGLETIEFQMSLFANMSEEEQLKMLDDTLDELAKAPELFRQMNEHWNKGDSDGLAKLMNDMDADSPALRKVLLTDRNATWADWIGKRMEKPGGCSSASAPAISAGRTASRSSSPSTASRANGSPLNRPILIRTAGPWASAARFVVKIPLLPEFARLFLISR